MIDDKEAIEALKKTDKKGKESEGKLSKIAKTGLKIGAGIVAGTGAAIGGLMAITGKSAEATDRIDKMSQKIGLSRQGFQEFDFIMSQSGMSVDQLQMGFKTLVTQVDQAVKGTGKGAESFKKLGISVTDTNGKVKDQETIFKESLIALQNMEAGSEKAKLANDLFGRSGAEMMPLLNSTSGSIEEMTKQAHDLGLVLSDEAVDAGVVYTDTMDQMKRSLGAAATQIGTTLMPIVQNSADWVIEHMPEIKKVMGVVFNFIGQVVTKAVDVFNDYLVPVFEAVFNWVKDNWPTIQKIGEIVFTIISEVIKTAMKIIGDVVKGAVEIFETYLLPIFKTIFEWVAEHWPTIQKVIETVMKVASTAVSVAVGIIKGVFEGLKTVLDTVTTIFDGIKNAITNPIETAKKIIGGIVDTIKGFFDFDIKLPKIKLPHFGIKPSGWKLGDLLKGQIPKLGIDWYAEGGIFDKPTIIPTLSGLKGVGDARSPEVVTPLHKLEEMLIKAIAKYFKDNDKVTKVINLNGNFEFRDKDDIDYFMEQAELRLLRSEI